MDIMKKVKAMKIVQIVMIVGAFALTVYGLIRNIDIFRAIIYGMQCLECALIFVFGVLKFKDDNGKIFKGVLVSYALLEALRAAILGTTGVNTVVGMIARFILAVLSCTSILAAERLGQDSFKRTAICMVVLEALLYLVFLFGFPGVMLGRFNRFMPAVGVLVALTILFSQTVKNADQGSVLGRGH